MRRKKHSFGKILFILIAVLAATAAGLFLGHTLKETGSKTAGRLADLCRQLLLEEKGTVSDGKENPDSGISLQKNEADGSSGESGENAGSADSESESLAEEDLYYYYSQLSEEEQGYYEEILAGLEAMDETIRVNTKDEELLWKLYTAVMDDHPELYWVEYSYTGTAVITHADLNPEYNCTAEEKEQKDRKLEAAEEEALAAVSGKESEYETVKSVFEYVVDTVEYDSTAEDNQNIYSALVNHSSVCAGYSREVQYLLQMLGIETIFVTGDITDRGAHAWNIVKIQDSYYQVDATFGDRAFTTGYTEEMPEELHYDYSYLCCDDRVMKDRTVDEDLTVPACTATDLNYYQLQGIYFDSYDSGVQDSVITGIKEGTRYFRCQFSNADAYRAMLNDVNDSWYAKMIRDYGSITSGQITAWSVHDDQNLVICLWY